MEILIRNGQRKHKVDSKHLKKRLAVVLEALEQNTCELSVLLTGDRKIKELNGQYRSMDKPTDVLSFPDGRGRERATASYHASGSIK